MKWVGGWDDDDEDEYGSAQDDHEVTEMEPGNGPPMLSAHIASGREGRGSFGNATTPLGVVREEGLAVSPGGFSGSAGS